MSTSTLSKLQCRHVQTGSRSAAERWNCPGENNVKEFLLSGIEGSWERLQNPSLHLSAGTLWAQNRPAVASSFSKRCSCCPRSCQAIASWSALRCQPPCPADCRESFIGFVRPVKKGKARGARSCSSLSNGQATSSTEEAGAGPERSQQLLLPTLEDFKAAAKERGVDLMLTSIGPLFSVEAKAAADGSGGPPGKLLGKADGFVLPFWGGKILHIDSMRMAKIESEKVRSMFGLAVILGGAVVRHGLDQGCKKAELLAINDSDTYHKKLVNYYSRLGFEAVHEVTGGFGDIPHMLVWGGLGTRMDADVEKILRKWSKRFVQGSGDPPSLDSHSNERAPRTTK